MARIQSQKHPQTQEAGFTLAEVMVATLLLMIVLIPALGMMISTVSAALTSETQNAATLLGQEQIEELKALDFDDLTIKSTGIDVSTGIVGSGPYSYTYEGTLYTVITDAAGIVDAASTVERGEIQFTVHRYVLQPLDEMGQPIEQQKKLVVRVAWTSPRVGDLVFETDTHREGFGRTRRPSVTLEYPFIGDAFISVSELSGGGNLRAIAVDLDGQPVRVDFQYKKNADASFSLAGAVDTTGVLLADGSGYEFSSPWTATLNGEGQYNVRAVVTDNDGNQNQVTVPIFLDPHEPAAPTTIVATNSDDQTVEAAGGMLTSPIKVTWSPVSYLISVNQSYDMISGYYLYRSERTAGNTLDTVGTETLIAIVHGAANTFLLDGLTADGTKEYRYRVQSMGRAKGWRTAQALTTQVPSQVSPWYSVLLPEATSCSQDTFVAPADAPAGTQVAARSTSWSAVELTWLPQYDTGDATSGPHRSDYYSVERRTAASDWVVVGGLTDTGSDALLYYSDVNLGRGTTYEYRITPSRTDEYPIAREPGISNPVTTDVY